MTVLEAAARRAEAAAGPAGEQIRGIPLGAARLLPFPAQLRAALVERDGKELHQLDGYATVFEREYEMWDFFGPFTEEVASDAADETLAANPDVAFLVNHRGVTMARTTAKTLELEADGLGLHSRAFVNPKRTDVRDLVVAIEDKAITEMSFAFYILEGSWNDDYTKYRIEKFDIDRGDVSAVNYGANPYTSIGARAREVLGDLAHLPRGAAVAALERLAARDDLDATTTTPEPPAQPADPTEPQDASKSGRATALISALLLADDDE